MQRRTFMQLLGAGALAMTSGIREAFALARPSPVFRHGVASGDPTQDAVIVWTRVTPATTEAQSVDWEVASDPRMRETIASGTVVTDADADFTVKVDVTGLDADTIYFYRFLSGKARSPIGRLKTLPSGAAELARLAVVSCSNHPAGYFNVYRDIVEHDDVDLVLHLGDYLYEYAQGQYATDRAEELGRVPDPLHEMVTLADYRRRHAQYKSDPDLQAMHGLFPMIAIWDDHEITNDAWRYGAQNHQDEEGEWRDRVDAALKAYFEWMPIRGNPNGLETRIFREFRIGDLASLIMLDTRLYRRDPQPNAGADIDNDSIIAALRDPSRRMLGTEQEEWLRTRLMRAEDTTWQIVGQQVMVARMEPPDLEPLVDTDKPSLFSRDDLLAVIDNSKNHAPQILDVWDGYPAAKDDLLRNLQEFAKNPVVLSGDLHTAMAANLSRTPDEPPVAVELMTPSVTSPGLSAYFPSREPHAVRDGSLAQNPHFRFLDIERRGWLRVELTRERCTGEWHLLDTVLETDFESTLAKTLAVRAGEISAGLS